MAEKKRILLIEDNPSFRKMLVQELGLDYTINEAGEANDAIKKLKFKPEVVILDLILPKEKNSLPKVEVGFGLLKGIKESDPFVSVIILTGKGENFDDVVKAIGSGADDYILKDRMKDDPERLPTAIKNALEKRRLLKKEAEFAIAQKEAELGRLASGIVHEISPIICLLSECFKDGDKEEGLRIVNRLKILNDELRAYYRRAGEVFTFSPCLLNETINGAIDLYKPIIKKEGIEVIPNFAKDGEINIDREKIKMVFSNLISNAIDAIKKAKREKGRLNITTFVDDSAVYILFEDNGCGIKRKYINEIFKPFVTSKKEGIGLGLAIASLIVKEHKGNIIVESKYGKGSRFTVKLPIEINH